MKIYKAEKLDGLADKIRSSASIAYITQLQPLDPQTPFAQKLVRAVASGEHPHNVDTLYPIKDVLVTTGWNLNTDVFDNGETWIARNTPVHHPLNFEHDEKRIIGNITASQAVDTDMSLISDDAAIDELPVKFHILNGSVIYRVWGDEEQQKLIDKTIAEIEKGEWYVSMECLFKGFDYAVIRPDGSTGVIPRGEESAFLTKHLRHYGGTGVYKCDSSGEEFKLGRVLRNINFIGKGLVRRPANPESVILNHVSAFASISADLGYIKAEEEVTSIDQPERIDMSDDNKKLEDRVAELVKQNETLATQLKERDGAEIDGLKDKVTTRDNKIQTLETTINELKESIGALTKRAEEAEQNKTQVEAELANLRVEKIEQSRLAVLMGKGATPDKAAELVKKFTKLTDEEFNDVAETLSAAWKRPEGKKPEQVINDAKPEKDVAMATPDEPADKSEERIAKAATLIRGFLRYSQNTD